MIFKEKALHCHGFQLNKNYYSLLSKAAPS